MIRILLGFHGQNHACHDICSEQEDSPDFVKQNSKNIHQSEAWDWTLRDIWLPSVFACTQREEVQARPFKEEWYIYEINSESSKTLKIYIHGKRKIDTNKDVFLE